MFNPDHCSVAKQKKNTKNRKVAFKIYNREKRVFLNHRKMLTLSETRECLLSDYTLHSNTATAIMAELNNLTLFCLGPFTAYFLVWTQSEGP